MNQTSLLSYCGLNLMKHKDILESLEKKGEILGAASFLRDLSLA